VSGTTLRLAYAGTPALAAVILESLATNPDYIIAQAYTQPDRPAGRGRKPVRSAVGITADKFGIPVLQPYHPADIDPDNRLSEVDVLVVAAYGLLLPADILYKPKWGCINVHTSLLPRWRGAAPIQRAIEAGDKETGISIMQMDSGLDTGPILLQESCPILPTDTGGTLGDRLAKLGSHCLIRTLNAMAIEQLLPRNQDGRPPSYARKIHKAEARIDWSRPAVEIERQVRAFNPHPVAFTAINGMTLRIWEVELLGNNPSGSPGRFSMDKQGLSVQTGEGSLRIIRIQAPGKKPVAAGDFLNGHPDLALATADPCLPTEHQHDR